MEREDAQRIMAFHAEQKGSHLTFQYVLPRSTPMGDLGGVPRVDVTTLAGAMTVIVRGWPPNRRVLRYGDMIRFSHQKVYQVTQSVTSDATGRGTLQLAPQLLQTVFDGEGLVTTGLTFTVSFVDDVLDVTLAPHQPTLLYKMNVSLIERF